MVLLRNLLFDSFVKIESLDLNDDSFVFLNEFF